MKMMRMRHLGLEGGRGEGSFLFDHAPISTGHLGDLMSYLN